MLAACRPVLDDPNADVTKLLDVGALLSSFGFLAEARAGYVRAQAIDPADLRASINLANLDRDSGEHKASRDLYADLLTRLPDHPVIRRNALISLEYDPEVTDADRLDHARAWGAWAIDRAGGPRPRPPLLPLTNRLLRLGYVSADLCQHTVGLFVKDVLKAHDPAKLAVFAYSAGQLADWVTQEIRAAATFREVARLDDHALAEQIRQDRIDILVDLSGHTAGSRLTVFAHRPAPVMVSWLGYFATTGLEYLDAVLLDKWHAPPGTEAQFAESIIRLPQRLCYTPVPFAPAVSPAPTFTNGHITFGSFNNTGKYNPQVFDLWAQILLRVPNSRLVLKWRTFNDEAFRQQVAKGFVERGIAAERIDLRGPSFHVDVLKEYADIDIALDPFPFTGGLTSCEALWMGVPVVTWPQSRVVSRQTYAFLNAIDLTELAAKDAEDYVSIAVRLAQDRERLLHLRTTLRQRMQASPLCDVSGFTRSLEDTLIALYRKIETDKDTMQMTTMTLLNVGAGHPRSGARIPAAFQTQEWKELRLDIDPANEPDVIGTLLDMSAVGDESVDAIYSSHTVEHLYPNEIPQAMKEFLRVLKPEGYAVIACPDLQAAAQMIAEDRLMDTAYTSPAGPVTPFDIVYSHRQFTGRDKPYMAHHCGFTLSVLIGTLQSNGFASVAGKRRPQAFDLWVVATKEQMEEGELRKLAERVLPG
jgi:SAM-dependent methyltransferase